MYCNQHIRLFLDSGLLSLKTAPCAGMDLCAGKAEPMLRETVLAIVGDIHHCFDTFTRPTTLSVRGNCKIHFTSMLNNFLVL